MITKSQLCGEKDEILFKSTKIQPKEDSSEEMLISLPIEIDKKPLVIEISDEEECLIEILIKILTYTV